MTHTAGDSVPQAEALLELPRANLGSGECKVCASRGRAHGVCHPRWIKPAWKVSREKAFI